MSFYPRFGKRLLDVLTAGIALVLLAPALALIALLVRINCGSPVLFRQQRPGRGGRVFTIRKFRTMADAHDAHGLLLPDADRMTRLGRFLRAASLDELPELFNVLVGEMSLVGPRPLLVAYLDRYAPHQMRRHDVLPGLTGWAQVNGRNAISWEQKFALDLWYVEHQSFRLDMRILRATVRQLIRHKGISQEGHATMPEFLGVGRPPPAER